MFVVVLILTLNEERIIEKDDLYLVIKDCLIYWHYSDVIFIQLCFKIIRICEIMALMEIMLFQCLCHHITPNCFCVKRSMLSYSSYLMTGDCMSWIRRLETVGNCTILSNSFSYMSFTLLFINSVLFIDKKWILINNSIWR